VPRCLLHLMRTRWAPRSPPARRADLCGGAFLGRLHLRDHG
jgi:hypothetical protein